MNNAGHLWPSRSAWSAWLLLALVSLFGLFDHSLWSSNETREGAMIREMAREGVWVTPVFNGRPYLEKPPLLHWTGLALCRLAGRVNEGLVRLPAALYGFGTLWLIGLWARALGRERAGVLAAFLCATSVLFFEYSRIVLTDASLTFMVLASLYLFWRAWEQPGRLRWAAFLAVSALSFYAKGLLGPGLIWVSAAGFLAWRRQWKRLFGLGALYAVVLAAVLAPWVWALWRAGGADFLLGVFWDNQFGRFLTFSDPSLPLDPFFVHKEPAWFYLQSLPLRLLPWTLLVLPSLAAWFRPKTPWIGPAAGFWRLALAGMLLVLHASAAKADCYTLPLFPFLFLMTGFWLDDAVRRWDSRLEQILIGATFGALALMALLVPAGYLAAFAARLPDLLAPGSAAVWSGAALAALALAAAIFAGRRLWRDLKAGGRAQVFRTAPLLLAALGVLNGCAYVFVLEYHRTYQPLAETVRREQAAGRSLALACPRERDLGALMFYLDSRLPAVSVSNRADCDLFVQAAPGSAGWIVDGRKLDEVRRCLEGVPTRIEPVAHGGYKSAGFLLVLRESPAPAAAGPGGTKGRP